MHSTTGTARTRTSETAMSTRASTQALNPLIGIYFGIFVASLTGIVVLLLIFEQLGVVEARLRQILLFGSLALYAAIGIAGLTTAPAEYLLAGRRVPPFFTGLALTATALGGTGLAAFTGAIFLIGLDALCVPMGVIAGLVATALLIAPFFRKFGAATVPGYLAMRFQSPVVRAAAAVAAAAPLILVLLAEIKIGVLAAGWLLAAPDTVLVLLVAGSLLLIAIPGGSRSLAWSGAAQSITALLAILTPAMIIAVMVTNLPLGQLSHGPVLRAVGRSEIAQGFPLTVAQAWLFDYPGVEPRPIDGRFATPFGSIGAAAYVLTALTVMAGIAVFPSLLGRVASATGVYDTRKSIGWGVFLTGVIIMTMSSIAVFYRDVLMHQIAGASPVATPAGFRTLLDLGLATVDPNATRLTASNVSFRRDGVLLGLPILMGLPASLVFLLAAGVLAAALAAAGAALVQLAAILAEDVIAGPPTEPRAPRTRLLAARSSVAVVAILAGLAASVSRRDPLDLVLWALALSAGGLFPVMVLSIWWKRLSAFGASAGLMAGFAATAITLVLAVAGILPIPAELSAIVGLPVGFGVCLVGTLVSPPPDRPMLEMVRDLRIPGGEPLHDREVRLARQRRHPASRERRTR